MNTKEKIVPLDSNLWNLIRVLPNRKIIQCHGIFDLLHPGHHIYLEEAKSLGDILVVTVTSDRYVNKGPGKPEFNEQLRAKSLADLEFVDYVIICDYPTAVEAIKIIKPTYYVKGSEYKDYDITGGIELEKEAVESVGGQLYFTKGVTFSSTSLINKYFNPFEVETQKFLEEIRGKYRIEDILYRFNKYEEIKVLVIGDSIIDRYCYVTPLGLSPKDNIINVRYINEESFAGGSLAIANHMSGFCKEVHLVTKLGLDKKDNYIVSQLSPNISYKFFYDNKPTVIKERFVEPDSLNKLFGLTYIDDTPIEDNLRRDICLYLEEEIPKYDLVIVADFGHGLIDGKDIPWIICEKSRFLALNVQTNSANLGFNLITKYPLANYVSVDELEARYSQHNKFSELELLIEDIRSLLDCRYISLTKGKHGSWVYHNGNICKIPAFSREVVDKVGAGDAYLAITSLLACSDEPPDLLGFVGNAVGALKVRTICNKEPINKIQLLKFIETLLK